MKTCHVGRQLKKKNNKVKYLRRWYSINGGEALPDGSQEWVRRFQ